MVRCEMRKVAMTATGQFRPLGRHFLQVRLAPNVGLRQPIPTPAPLSINPNAAPAEFA